MSKPGMRMKPEEAFVAAIVGVFTSVALAGFLLVGCEVADGAGVIDPRTRGQFAGPVLLIAALIGAVGGILVCWLRKGNL